MTEALSGKSLGGVDSAVGIKIAVVSTVDVGSGEEAPGPATGA
jgi:hypothetical protein